MTQRRYGPSHLKVTLDDPTRSLSDGLVDALQEQETILREMNRAGKTDRRAFVSFRQVDRTSTWALIALSPYSKDSGITDTSYSTREEAVGAAVDFFTKRGLNAKPFDFYGMIDSV